MSALTAAENGNTILKTSEIDHDISMSIETETETYAKVVVEPLNKGYGVTLGNSLRRSLLSSISGFAVCGIRIQGVVHQFEAISGIKEDLVDILLNLKNLKVRFLDESSSKVLKIVHNDIGPITAGNIQTDDSFEILNPNLVLCNLTSSNMFEAELYCARGVGYSVAQEQNKPNSWPSDIIPVDALYSPVTNVTYNVENARVGQATNYDKLVLHVHTNGCVTPVDALSEAAKMISSHLSLFIKPSDEEMKRRSTSLDSLTFDPILLEKISDIGLIGRPFNGLKSVNIVYIGDLVTKSEKEIMSINNVGAKSFNEIMQWLESVNLTLGMDVPDWPPENVADLSEQFKKSKNKTNK